MTRNRIDTIDAKSTAAHLTGRKVLVVDESAVQCKLLSSVLLRRGYRTATAESGARALRVQREFGAEIIISDWMMPGMSGPELCEALRDRNDSSYAYFILLTSKNEREDVAEGLERGADDFLTKPVNLAELSARLTAGERILSMQQAMAIKNAELSQTLTHLNAAQDAMQRDLDDARHLQQSLVPERQRTVLGGQVSLLLRPSGAVGGDLVGSFRISETRIGLFAIDVAGHGIASALMTARLAGYLTSSSPDQNIALTIDDMGLYSMHPPADVCQMLNRIVLEEMTTDLYFTMLMAECDLRSGCVELAQAGHPPPLILRLNGAAEFVGNGGLPVGLIHGACFDPIRVHLNPGDRVLFYSDGVTECEDPDGGQLGENGFAAMAQSAQSQNGTEFLDSIVARLIAFSGQPEFSDDVSMAMFEYSGL